MSTFPLSNLNNINFSSINAVLNQPPVGSDTPTNGAMGVTGNTTMGSSPKVPNELLNNLPLSGMGNNRLLMGSGGGTQYDPTSQRTFHDGTGMIYGGVAELLNLTNAVCGAVTAGAKIGDPNAMQNFNNYKANIKNPEMLKILDSVFGNNPAQTVSYYDPANVGPINDKMFTDALDRIGIKYAA
jgi:hypothetical protein